MKVLFDLNVVLDLLLDRAPWAQDAKALVAHVLAGRIDGYVCATAIPTFVLYRSQIRRHGWRAANGDPMPGGVRDNRHRPINPGTSQSNGRP